MKLFTTKKQANFISEVLKNALKECETPQQREVIAKINSELTKQWDNKVLDLEELELLTSCFEKEKSES